MKFKNLNSLIVNSVNLTDTSQVPKLNSVCVYIFILYAHVSKYPILWDPIGICLNVHHYL